MDMVKMHRLLGCLTTRQEMTSAMLEKMASAEAVFGDDFEDKVGMIQHWHL